MKTLLDQYRGRKEERKINKQPHFSAILADAPDAHLTTTSTSENDTCALIQAELNNHKFSCRIDSGADLDVVSETIINLFGDCRKTCVLKKNPDGLYLTEGGNTELQSTGRPTLQADSGRARRIP